MFSPMPAALSLQWCTSSILTTAVWKLIWQSLGGWLSVIATWDFRNIFASDFSGMHFLFPCPNPAAISQTCIFYFPA
jgi:hypothetical protein